MSFTSLQNLLAFHHNTLEVSQTMHAILQDKGLGRMEPILLNETMIDEKTLGQLELYGGEEPADQIFRFAKRNSVKELFVTKSSTTSAKYHTSTALVGFQYVPYWSSWLKRVLGVLQLLEEKAVDSVFQLWGVEANPSICAWLHDAACGNEDVKCRGSVESILGH